MEKKQSCLSDFLENKSVAAWGAAIITVLGGWIIANNIASKFECQIEISEIEIAKADIYKLRDTLAGKSLTTSEIGNFLDVAVGPLNRLVDKCQGK